MSRKRNRSNIKRNSRKPEKKNENPNENTVFTQEISFDGIKFNFTSLPFGSTKITECTCDGGHECKFELNKTACTSCGTETKILVYVDDFVVLKRPITKITE